MKTEFGFKKADLIIFSVLLLVMVFYGVLCLTHPSFGSYVTVKVDGKVIDTIPLSNDGEYPVNGGTNTVVIHNRIVWVVNADCPDKLCEKMGKIKYSGQSIICLPNKLTVQIEGSVKDVDIII